jgi:predicted Zn-dependent peptidase
MMWSHRGIEATDERRFNLNLIIDALGSFEGFLFDQLRNKNGWCYGAYAFAMQATTRPGRIAYYADPTSETSTLLIPEMLRLLQLFPDEKDFQERLAERNATFKNRYAYQLDLKKKLSNEINRDRYGIPILTKEEYYQRIDAVTLATAKKTIAEVFDPKNITMVFYGDAERLKNILTKLDSSVKITLLEKEILIQ